jgi:hypothetical protein
MNTITITNTAYTFVTGFNGHIACAPPENVGVQQKVKSGFATTQHRNTLAALTVVFGSEKIPAGAIVHLRADSVANLDWGRKVYELDGTSFILVPEALVLLVQKTELPSFLGSTTGTGTK